jgi:hypothetical protein
MLVAINYLEEASSVAVQWDRRRTVAFWRDQQDHAAFVGTHDGLSLGLAFLIAVSVRGREVTSSCV